MGLAADIQSKINEAVEANESGDYSLAASKMRSAILLMAGHPRLKFEETETEYVRDDLVAMANDFEKLAAKKSNRSSESGGFTSVPIRLQTR